MEWRQKPVSQKWGIECVAHQYLSCIISWGLGNTVIYSAKIILNEY
jgi:hypothetical protein